MINVYEGYTSHGTHLFRATFKVIKIAILRKAMVLSSYLASYLSSTVLAQVAWIDRVEMKLFTKSITNCGSV
jgi:hypothetical protein